MAGEKVGEAYVDIRYRLGQLAADMRTAQAQVSNQVDQLNRTVQQKTDGMFAGVTGQLQGASVAVTAFGAAFAAAIGSQALQAVNALKDKIAETGSAFQQMQARLDQTLGAGAFDETIAMANRLGVAIKDAADSTARFGMAAQDIGLTKEQTLLLTETVVKLGRIGNSSAQEMSAGMQQLGQALASGKFQGDELRSVLEQMPEVARALARELGVGIGELRRMGSEGELTADVVAKALLGAADDAAARFAKLPESLEQSQARWENAVDQLYAAFDKAWSVSPAVKWWNRFWTENVEGLTVDLGGGTAETQIAVLERRLKQLEATRLLGRSAEADSLRQQIAELRLTNLPGVDAPGLDPALGGSPNYNDPALKALYGGSRDPEQERKDALGVLQDKAEGRKQDLADQERANRQAEAEAERHANELRRLEAARAADTARAMQEDVDAEEKRLEQVKQANERLAKVNQEARQDELRAARQARRVAIEDDPAGYYARTGDSSLAPVYDAATGAKEALKELGDQSQQYGKMVGDGIKAGADVAAQGLTQMALTGKFAVKSLLKDLAELAVNQIFQRAIAGGLNMAFGPSAAAPTGAGGGPRGYARGGVFDRGHVVPLARGGIVSAATIVPLARGAALMGEAGPEAVMPLGRDGSGRLGVRGTSGGTKVVIQDMRGAGAPPVQTREQSNDQGGIDVIAVIHAEVEKGIGGGRYDNALNARFGQRPRTTR